MIFSTSSICLYDIAQGGCQIGSDNRYCAHVIGNGIGFTRFYPLVSKADTHLSLKTSVRRSV